MEHQFVGVFFNVNAREIYTLPTTIDIDSFRHEGMHQQMFLARKLAHIHFDRVAATEPSQQLMGVCERPCKDDLSARLVLSLVTGELTRKEAEAYKQGRMEEVRGHREDRLKAKAHACACEPCKTMTLWLKNPSHSEVLKHPEPLNVKPFLISSPTAPLRPTATQQL